MHQRLCSGWRQAGSGVRVVLVHVRARVLWAPGFSRADVSNQSLSRSSFIPLSRCWWSCGEMGMAPPPPPLHHRLRCCGAAWSCQSMRLGGA